ncbi:prepilin-type N-terminal cleavage/methylation domain-containing protein [Butyrivibrio sp. AE3006]|uniref:prepilin-type N-terminal cleavage/methylation domain-containing protein n=1 Tax=Butyrivibrio sp. AE3006 TaxID=1280673 RepID=UPI0003FDB85F|nr:prepilin-type N-terminal cleavage/methylation domain-containing protein [Butyrivibrio sp. AE3006]
MKKMLKRLNSQEGFTLAELLIVVAIIAVLVAISIPVFTSQLEKSREATDAANLRAAYAEQTAALLSWDGTSDIPDKTVVAKQTQDDWQTGSVDIGGITTVEAKTSGDTWTVSADTDHDKVTIE